MDEAGHTPAPHALAWMTLDAIVLSSRDISAEFRKQSLWVELLPTDGVLKK
jgi:hypothetical protein